MRSSPKPARTPISAILALTVFLTACATFGDVRRGSVVRSESRVGPPIGANPIVVPESVVPGSGFSQDEGLHLILYEESTCKQYVREIYKEVRRENVSWDMEDVLKKKCSESPPLCPLATVGYLTLLPMAVAIYPFVEKHYADVETGNLIESDWQESGVIPCGRAPVVNGEVSISISNVSFSAKGKTDSAGRIVLSRSDPGIPEMLQAAAVAGESVEVEVRYKNRAIPLHLFRREIVAKFFDMSPSTPDLAAYPVATFAIAEGKTVLEAGRTTNLIVEVTNRGKGETSQLKAVIGSPDRLLNGRELLFGKILPGKRRVWIEPVNVPLLGESKEVPIRIVFSEGNGYVPGDIEAKLTVKGRGRPQFAYSVQVVDGGSATSVGNQDGRIQRGESVDLVLYLKNTGTEEAQDVRGELGLPPEAQRQVGEGIRLREATRTVERLAPDEVVPVRFGVDVLRRFQGVTLPLQLAFREDRFGTRLERQLVLPIDQEIQRQPIEIRREVTVRAATVVYSGAGQDTSPLAHAREGTVLRATGEYADWYRVEWGKERVGWIAKTDVQAGSPPPTAGTAPADRTGGVIEVFSNSPPTIALASPGKEQVVEADQVLLQGVITDAKAVGAVWIAVNGRPLPEATLTSGLRHPSASEVEVKLSVPLTPGPNTITIRAVNPDNLQREETRRIVRVEPRGAQLEALSDVDRFILDPKLPALAPNPRRWALVIGVEKYRQTVGADFARRDATVFREYARKRLGVSPENIALLLDEDATKANLEVELKDRLPRRVRSGDEIVVYFAGHGLADPATRQPYLLPADGNPESLAVSGMSLEALYTALGSLPAARVVVFLDACFSGPTGRGAEVQPLLAQARPGTLVVVDPVLAAKNLVVLAAAQGNQVSNSISETGHGLFTYHLLKGLSGAADTDRDGRVRLGELAAYVRDAVDQAARLRFGGTRSQTPTIRPEVLDAARDLDLVGR